MSENESEETPEQQDEDLESEQEHPKRWVEQYLSEEEWILDHLDEIKEQEFEGNYSELREKLNRLYEYNRDVYRVLLYSINRREAFFEDVESQLGEEIAKKLRNLATKYQNIGRELAYVVAEDQGRKNSFTGGEISEPIYRPAREDIHVPYTIHSGGAELLEVKDSPGNLLHGSILLAEAAHEGVRAADEGSLVIENEEHERIRDKISELREKMEEIENHLDGVETTTNEERYDFME